MMAMNVRLPLELDRRLESELMSGEKVIWTAQPVPGRAPQQARPLRTIGAVFLGVATLLAGVGAAVAVSVHRAEPFAIAIPAVPFGILGTVFSIVGWVMTRAARRTAYAITDRRAIVLEPARCGFPETTRSYSPAALASIVRRERPDGSGDLVFDERAAHPHVLSAGFIGVADVREVERMLRATLLA